MVISRHTIYESVNYRAISSDRPRDPLGARSVGLADMPSGVSTPWRIIDFAQILWVEEGRGRMEVNGRRHALDSGMAAVYSPGDSHRITSVSRLRYRWFTLDGACVESMVSILGLSGKPFHVGACPVEDFAKLRELIQLPETNVIRDASSLAYALLCRLSKSPSVSRSESELMVKARNVLERAIGDSEANIKTLADQLGVSRSTLLRLFNNATGMPPKNYLESMRLNRAMALLRNTDFPVWRIAGKCGFANSNYFGKFFRKKCQCAPLEFRRKGES